MAAPIEFWFDFSSPYGFLASTRIDALAARHGRTVDWRVTLLGVVFKSIGTTPLVDIPLKGDYSRRDFVRSAEFHGVAGFRMPARFPIPTQAPQESGKYPCPGCSATDGCLPNPSSCGSDP